MSFVVGDKIKDFICKDYNMSFMMIVLIMEDWKWRLLVDALVCLKCVRHIESDWCEINYSINNCHLNNKSHVFYLREDCEFDHEM